MTRHGHRVPGFRRSFTNFGAYLPAPAGAADLLTRRKGGQRRFAMKPDMSHFDRPAPIPPERFEDAAAALGRLELIYDRHTAFIRERFAMLLKNGNLRGHVRATYPEIRVETSTFAQID